VGTIFGVFVVALVLAAATATATSLSVLLMLARPLRTVVAAEKAPWRYSVVLWQERRQRQRTVSRPNLSKKGGAIGLL
jgi:hypothetical protein